MEKIILSRENIEKNREKILEAYAAPSKSSNKLPTPTKKQRKLLGMGRDRGTATAKYIWEETEEQQQLSTLELLPVR